MAITPRRPAMVTFKQAIQTALLYHLYEPVRQRHLKQIETLAFKNCTLRKSGVRAFRYKGDLYRSELAETGPIAAPRLHEDLEWEMAQMLEELHEINVLEQPMVKGYITLVLNSSDHIEDYLLLLPSSVHRHITSLGLSYHGERKFNETTAAELRKKHDHCIQLIKERMVSNLIFQ